VEVTSVEATAATEIDVVEGRRADGDEAVARAIAAVETAPAEQRSVQAEVRAQNQTDGQPILIQRTAEALTAPLSTPETKDTNEDTEEKKPGEADVDIDELARRVYSDLRRRLVVEWERRRGRF
jgi:hypothetical protein